MVHAAGESSDRLPEGTIAVALETEDENSLKDLASRLEDAEITHVTIVEGEGPYASQLMAIGIEPVIDRDPIKRVVSSLPLVR